MTDFDQIYSDVPNSQREQLRSFRDEHPSKHTVINGVMWEYIVSGRGEQVVLLLVGGLRVADAAFRNIPLLEDEFTVITPTYPPLTTMAELADGLAGILDVEGVRQSYVLAGSFGGMLAQVYVRRYPDRVDRLVLSTTAVFDAGNAERYRQAIQMIEPVDSESVAEIAKEQLFHIIAPPEEDHVFYRAYLNELYTYRVDKAAILSTYYCLLDFADHYSFTPDDLKDWTGTILILESDDDATFDDKTRAMVRLIYPMAKTCTFHNAGHSPGTTQRDLYFQIVKDFFKVGNSPS